MIFWRRWSNERRLSLRTEREVLRANKRAVKEALATGNRDELIKHLLEGAATVEKSWRCREDAQSQL